MSSILIEGISFCVPSILDRFTSTGSQPWSFVPEFLSLDSMCSVIYLRKTRSLGFQTDILSRSLVDRPSQHDRSRNCQASQRSHRPHIHNRGLGEIWHAHSNTCTAYLTFGLFVLILFTYLVRSYTFATMKYICRVHIALTTRATVHTMDLLYGPIQEHQDDWIDRLDYRCSNTQTTPTLRWPSKFCCQAITWHEEWLRCHGGVASAT
jgi:hypothetical protein